MSVFFDRKQLQNASDEEIEAFFKSIVFRGQYSEFPPEHEDNRFCGKIEHITINGITNDLCPDSLYVLTKFSQFVKSGLCEFNALPVIKILHGERHQYKLIITRVKNIAQKTVRRDKKAESRFRYNLKLKDDKFVGQFTENKDGSFTIRDIRRSDFSKLILQNGKEQAPIVYHPHLFRPKDGKYYEFSWILNGEKENYVYLFKVDETQAFQEVTPKNLIKRLHDDIMNYPAGAGQKIVKMLDTLKTQLTASGKEIFIYELLQNANDYPVIINNVKQKVDVEFHLTLSSLIFMHSGAVFNEKNIAAICSINDKEKDTNKDAIGYKGIGFKTVFLDNENVYLQTGDYSFRFDRQATKDIVDTPWQILPIWTYYQELTPAERAIFTLADEKFRVKFALKPTKIETLRSSEPNYANMFLEIFKNERVILFIPNLSTVKVYLKGTPIPDIVCSRDNTSWRVDDFKELINKEITEAINSDIDEQEDTGSLKIPTKYYNFNSTKVSFACEIDGRKLKAVKDTCLYCYLPAKDATWGLKFLMNTDMIPNGARDDVEVDFENSTNVNETIANIAGSKLFEWILKLTKCGEYELDSIYNLIPNFASLKSGRLKYKNLINSFEKGFVNRVETDEFVPTLDGYACLLDVIVDETGLTSCGIMSDEDFLKFSDNEEKRLPNLELRSSDSFESFAKTFLRKFDVEENIFAKERLREMISKDDFQVWFKVQENNNKFLKFLLDNNYLEDLLDEKLFLEDKGSLQTACALYYDADEYLEDLQAFTNHIYFLSRKTREYFNGNEKWDKVIDGKFARFNPKDFVDNNLLSQKNMEETKEKLKDKNTSIHFFKFLAENVEFSQAYKDLPYISDEGIPVESFNSDFIFIENEEGKLQTKAKWLEGIPFSFISADYGEDVLNYFKNTPIEGSDVSAPTFGVLDYDKSIIIKHVILNEKYAKKVNANQQKNDNAHKSFISFCYTNKDTFNTGSLKQYAIKVNERNKDEETRHELTEANVFFETTSYDAALAHPWIGADWMFSLSNDLLSAELSTDTEQLKKFYEDKFGVKDFSNQIFYDDIVSKNMDAILKATSKPVIERADNVNLLGTDLSVIATAKKSNIDFVSYLNNNVDIIFKDNNFTKFNKLALLDSNEEFIGNNSVTFFYNEALSNFMSKAWLPSNIVNMCSKSYGHSTALEKMQVNQNPRIKYYDFATLYNLVIVSNLTVINKYLDDKTVNFDFHNSIIANIGSITPDDRKKISNAKVFIRGKELPVVPASGHKIVSKTVEELVELSLVDYSELDLLDQNYHANEHADYWQEALCNESFSIKSFLNWLINNKETIAIKLQDKTLNIKFWRWAKKNIKDKISCLLGLPILVKGKDVPCTFSGEIYFSDEYLDTPIESLVTTVAPNAPILTSDYISLGEEKKEWVDFWTQLGVQQNEVEVLENIIRTRLSATKVSNLAELIYKNRVHLEAKFDNNLMGLLADIQLVGTDYQYRAAKDCAFVSCAKEEPFAYISIPNRVGSSQAGINSFIGEIIQRHNSAHYITDLNKWRQEKLRLILHFKMRINKQKFTWP